MTLGNYTLQFIQDMLSKLKSASKTHSKTDSISHDRKGKNSRSSANIPTKREYLPKKGLTKLLYWLIFSFWLIFFLFASFFYYQTEFIPVGQVDFGMNFGFLGEHILIFFASLVGARLSTNFLFFGQPLRAYKLVPRRLPPSMQNGS